MPRQRTTRTGTNQDAQSGTTSKDQVRDQAQGSSMVDEAKDKARELADQAQQKATQQLHEGVSKGKNRAADTLGSLAQSLVFSSQRLREEDRGTISGYVEKAANRVEQLADYVQNTDASEMADRFENFARREPGIFLGGAFTLGLLGARFIKSSRRGQRPYQGGAPYRGAYAAVGQEYSSSRGAVFDREVPLPPTQRDYDVAGRETRSAGAPGTTGTGNPSAVQNPNPTSPEISPLGSEDPDRY
jgi:vacuolar-type H+-ATPase subunit H